ncbi:MAG TPA: hypothetical protein VGF96_16740 [Terracidiphilus sp.]
MAHQSQIEKVRENYTYSSIQTIQDIDSNGKVKKTETEERNDFFVNGHLIERIEKKDGQALSGRDEEKENDRVARLIEKAQKTPSSQFLENQNLSVSQLLDLMDLRNSRRILFHGRPTFVFDFIGRKDAKTHGLAEDASKKLQGTVWIDEADRQVAHLEVSFNDNFHIAGGLFATVDKGSNFEFDQAPVEGGLWLPTGGEANVRARLLMVKSLHQHLTERDFGFEQFQVKTQQANEAQVAPASRH